MKIRHIFLLFSLIISNAIYAQKRLGIQDYNSVSNVQAETIIPKNNDKIYIKSLNGIFAWDATSTATDNGTTVIKQNSINTGRFLLINPNTDWNLNGNVGTTAGTNFVGTTDAQGLSIKTNNTEAIRIDATQNVGIGTPTPNAILHVESAATTTSPQMLVGNANISGNYGTQYRSATAAGAYFGYIGTPANGGSVGAGIIAGSGKGISLYTGSSSTDPTNVGNIPRVNILQNGNVGIAITGPQNTLHIGPPVVANTSGVRLPITSASATQTGQPIGVDANGDIVRIAGGGTFDATVDFSVNTDPNIGGTTFLPNTPALTTVLYVSTINGSQWTYNGTNYVTAPVTNNWLATGNAATVQATNFVGTTDNIGLSFRTNNAIRQTISNTGNVGIGTVAPNTKLEIDNTTVNTSGLRLTRLLSTSPTTAGQTIGVNATGDVVAVSTAPTIQTLNATGTVTAWNSTVLIGATPLTANATITLPTVVNNTGKAIRFIRLDNTAFSVTIVGNGTETVVMPLAAAEIQSQNGAITIQAIDATTARQSENLGTVPITIDYTTATLTSGTSVLNATLAFNTNQRGNIPNSAGIISLTANKVYHLRAVITVTGTTGAGTSGYTFVDAVSGTPISGFTNTPITTSGANFPETVVIEGAYTPTANQTIKVMCTSAGTAGSQVPQLVGSSVSVYQTNGFFPVSTADFWNLNGNTLTGSKILGSTDNTDVNIQSGTGNLNVGATATAQSINLGTGSAAKSITLGNQTGTTGLTFNSGTAGETHISNTTVGAAHFFSAPNLANGSTLQAISTSPSKIANATGIDARMSGALTTPSITTYGANIQNTHTGTTLTNVGLQVSASGATNNYGLLVPNGLVGIGTTTPTEVLTVSGNTFSTLDNTGIAVGAGTSSTIGLIKKSGTSGSISAGSTQPIIFSHSNQANVLSNIGTAVFSERMRIVPTTGNVGIATTAPVSTLEVNGSFGTQYVSIIAAAYTALSTDHTIQLSLGGLQTLTLPAVASSDRREYRITNSTGTVKAFAASVTGLDGAATTVIPANSSLLVKSTGGAWRIVEQSITTSGFPTTLTTTTTTGTITTANTQYMQLTAVPAGTYDCHYRMTMANADANNREWATGLTINNAAQSFATGADAVATILGSLAVNHPFTVVGYNRLTLAATGTIEVKGQIFGTQAAVPSFAGTNRLTCMRVQ